MNEKWQKWYDYSTWVVLGLILLWTILKMLGIINTPLIIQYAPILGAVYLGGNMIQKLNRLSDDVKQIDKKLTRVEKDVTIIKERCPKFC